MNELTYQLSLTLLDKELHYPGYIVYKCAETLHIPLVNHIISVGKPVTPPTEIKPI